MGSDVAENELVAVGRRLRHTIDAGHAAGAANVFHDDRLAKLAAQSLGKNASNRIGRSASGERYHHSYRPQRIVLRLRRDRPRRRRAAEQRQELAPLAHSITSSAVASSEGGTVRRSIRAVEPLITSSNLLDCTTGKSAGLAPLRMRPVYMPTWRYASPRLGP